ncbi:dicarboxylate/amino acid:cation symporter [Daejeonella lutea]|uniref:Na+/H+-dicarboxylate symporter n=1 Tax=Daejeonella lutea TaxID=572036 RepID=A0A1T5DMF2_9SPHI|nr:dicarboxylate/amino acid:cation symporter [Daejeonella lutea]SKB72877.1 Na+/H+-dicarboxylate symporter [Daejeonella lutea]
MILKRSEFLKNYSNIILLLIGIISGTILGLLLGKKVEVLKPIGDIFLNLLFTAVIPLIFFAISSSIANIDRTKKMGKVMVVMFSVFVGTVLISAILTVLAVWMFPLPQNIDTVATVTEELKPQSFGDQAASLLTVNEFYELLSRKSMLAFIIFSFLVGFAASRSGEAGESFKRFLTGGDEVMKQLLILIMKLAPIGLGAYFAYQIGVFGPQLFGTYAHSMAIYYGLCTIYFVVFFSFYAFIAAGIPGVNIYWKNNIIPSFTALSTCSSVATIPANLAAAKAMKVPEHIANLAIPLGAPIHKDGSSISSIIKIAAVFAIMGKDFTDPYTILVALGITVIVSTVEGGIPNGGYIGEILVMTVYNFPIEMLPVVMIIGTLVDPMATLLNACGDTVCAMMVTRFTEGKNWLKKAITSAA